MTKKEEHNIKLAFLTNMCTHYVVQLFEKLNKKYDLKFYFTGGHEDYWNKNNQLYQGKFVGEHLKGVFLTSKLKITPKLFKVLFGKYNIFIKTIDDRFAVLFTFFFAKLLGKKFILWAGLWNQPTTGIHKITGGLTRYIYRHSDAIVTYGVHINRYLENLGVKAEKIFAAPHSVNNGAFNQKVDDQERNKLYAELGFQAGKVLLYVGRLDECKGLAYLIDALSNYEGALINLVFVGSGPQEQEYKDLCSTKLKLRYKFIDHVPNEELYKYYNLADILVLPSITTKNFKEPWGLVVNEAMNQGCVVTTTDAVGAAAGGLVEDGVTGFVVPEKDAGALKVAIEKLTSNDDLYARMRNNTLDKISTWTVEETFKGFIKAIDYVQRDFKKV